MQRRQRRLAAAGLADEAERLALPDVEADAATALRSPTSLETMPARDREVLDEVLDDQQVITAVRGR